MSLIKNKLAQSFATYTLSNVINSAIPFLLLPVLTTYLTTEDYGVLSNFNALIMVLTPFVGINLMASVSILYVKPEVNKAEYISTGIFFIIGLTIFFSLILFFFVDAIHHQTGVPKMFIYSLSLYALFSNLIELILAIWRMEDKAFYYGTFRIGKTILELALSLVLIILFKMSFEGSIYAMYFSAFIATVVCFVIFIKKKILELSFSKQYLKHILQYGLPLILHTLSGTIILYSDKLIVTRYHGLSATGIYSVGFLVGQIIGLFQNSFNQAWLPWAFVKLKEGEMEMKLKMVKMTYLYFAGILLLTLALWIGTPVVYDFIGKEFHSGMDMVLWVALGFAFNGMYKMVSVYIFYAEKTFLIALLSAGVAILNLGLNFLWVPEYGAIGAAIATTVSFFIHFLLTWRLSHYVLPMPWRLRS